MLTYERTPSEEYHSISTSSGRSTTGSTVFQDTGKFFSYRRGTGSNFSKGTTQNETFESATTRQETIAFERTRTIDQLDAATNRTNHEESVYSPSTVSSTKSVSTTTTGTGTGSSSVTAILTFDSTNVTEQTTLSASAGSTLAGDTYSSASSNVLRETTYRDKFSGGFGNTSAETTSLYSTSGSSDTTGTSVGSSSTLRTVDTTLRDLEATRANTDGQYDAITTVTLETSFGTTTTSTWGISDTTVAFPGKLEIWTPESTDGAYNPHTFQDHSTGAVTAPNGTTVSTVTSFTTKRHALSPLKDTYIFLDYQIAVAGHKHTRRLWTFKRSLLSDASATTKGVFSDLYASVAGDSFLLTDGKKFLTSVFEATAVDLSRYSTTRTSTSTAPSTGTGTNPVTSTYTRTTIYDEVGSLTNFDSQLFLLSTSSVGYPVSGVSDEIRTLGIGTDTYTQYVISHTEQETGYSDFVFTSATISAAWPGEISSTGNYQAWVNSRTESTTFLQRKTSAYTILMDSGSVIGTGTATSYVNFGQVTTTSVFTYAETETTNYTTYRSTLSPRALNYLLELTTIGGNTSDTTGHTAPPSSYTGTAPETAVSGSYAETYRKTEISETISEQYLTSQRIFPRCSPYTPIEQQLSPFEGSQGIAYRINAYPSGYVGWGGHETGTPIVGISVSAQKLEGEEFGTVSFSISGLSTASFAEGLTMFPVPSRPITHAHARQASYISLPSSLGGAEIAVTWTSTTSTTNSTGGSTSVNTSKTARYSLGLDSTITGAFVKQGSFKQLQDDALASIQYMEGGGGLGIAQPNEDWTVTAMGYGRVSWTEYLNGDTQGTSRIIDMPDASSTFTVATGMAVAYSGEELLTAKLDPGELNQIIVKYRYPR